MVIADFYRAFEEKHRGSRELIKDRLHVYLPYLRPLQTKYPGHAALDLGCGRGEWLELLRSEGMSAYGVDLDAGMLEACRVLDLDAKQGDALSALKTVPDQSLIAVSAFHLVEHISFDDLQVLVTEALRVLLPGGVLIMETPNPENTVVAGCDFYRDPTHQRPIPPALLRFMAEYGGFARTSILRLQEPQALHAEDAVIRLTDVMYGVSPDYAIVGQKVASPEVLSLLDQGFGPERGLSMHQLTHMYDRQAELNAKQTEGKLRDAEDGLRSMDAKLQSLESSLAGVVHDLQRFREHQAAREAQHADELSRAYAELKSVYQSSSWWITKPLRAISQIFKK